MRQVFRCCPWAIGSLVLLLANVARPQIGDLEAEFDRMRAARPAAIDPSPVSPSAASDELDVFKFMRDFRAYQNEIGRVRGTVTFGTTSDGTASQDQFKANAGIDLSVGTFPSQLRVATKADIRTADDKLVDDVSTFLINFDHYFALSGDRQEREHCRSLDRANRAKEPTRCEVKDDGPSRYVESFAFIERFSDSFLSIDRRFEVGVGMKLEWHSWQAIICLATTDGVFIVWSVLLQAGARG